MPSEWRDWAIGEFPKFAAMVDHEAAKFSDHWRSTGKAKRDWQATWRNWWRRAVEQAPRTYGLIPNARERGIQAGQEMMALAEKLERDGVI